jgi:hypothetical protein
VPPLYYSDDNPEADFDDVDDADLDRTFGHGDGATGA